MAFLGVSVVQLQLQPTAYYTGTEPLSPQTVVSQQRSGATGVAGSYHSLRQSPPPPLLSPNKDKENAAAVVPPPAVGVPPPAALAKNKKDVAAVLPVPPIANNNNSQHQTEENTATSTTTPDEVAPVVVVWPRIVFFHDDDRDHFLEYPIIQRQNSNSTTMTRSNRSFELEGAEAGGVGQSVHEDDWHSPHNDHNCAPKADWQVASHPNCNSIHEIDLQQHDRHRRLTVLGEGWFRTTWRYDETPTATNNNGTTMITTTTNSVVLKTLRIAREFIPEYYELHRRDAVAMERLTASPFVVNIYGYCGQSAINELADFPYANIQNLEGFNRRMRGNDSPPANIIRLRMAASIALGLADIHAGGGTVGRMSSDASEEDDNDNTPPQVYMAHYDLNPRNIALFAGGKPKINDFNIAEFIQSDPVTQQDCKFPSRLHEPWWRAPEEMNTTHVMLVNEKVDVYALGNILYHTLTTHSSRGSQTKDRMNEVRPIVAAGIRPVIPSHYRSSQDPNVKAMVKAIDLCWEKDPEKRVSAADVAAVLYDALVKIAKHSAASSSSSVAPSDQDVAAAAENNNSTAANDTDGPDDEMQASGEDKGAVADHNWDSSSAVSSSP
jgi:serine/threonine protein kinase